MKNAISISAYKISKTGGEVYLDFLPDMEWKEGDSKELVFARLVEMTEDINKIVNFDGIIGEELDEGMLKFHHKIERLEEKMELDLADIIKGYLGFTEYEFAKGIIKDFVEDKNEENMQQLYSSIEIK